MDSVSTTVGPGGSERAQRKPAVCKRVPVMLIAGASQASKAHLGHAGRCRACDCSS